VEQSVVRSVRYAIRSFLHVTKMHAILLNMNYESGLIFVLKIFDTTLTVSVRDETPFTSALKCNYEVTK